MEEGEEDEAVGESVAHGPWSHEGRLVARDQRRCSAAAEGEGHLKTPTPTPFDH